MKKIEITVMPLVDLEVIMKKSNTALSKEKNVDVFDRRVHFLLEEHYQRKIDKYYINPEQTQLKVYFDNERTDD